MLPTMSLLTGLKATEPILSVLRSVYMVNTSFEGAQRTKKRGQRLGSLEEIACGYSIVILGVDGNVDEGFVEGVEPGATGWVG